MARSDRIDCRAGSRDAAPDRHQVMMAAMTSRMTFADQVLLGQNRNGLCRPPSIIRSPWALMIDGRRSPTQNTVSPSPANQPIGCRHPAAKACASRWRPLPHGGEGAARQMPGCDQGEQRDGSCLSPRRRPGPVPDHSPTVIASAWISDLLCSRSGLRRLTPRPFHPLPPVPKRHPPLGNTEFNTR